MKSMNMMYARGALAAFCLFAMGSLAAAEGVTTGLKLDCTATTIPEIKTTLTGEAKIPFLKGSGALTADNNVKVRLSADLSPASVGASFETVWTPIAFAEIVAGASAGSGWNIPAIGANGLRMNERDGLHDNKLTGGALDGMVWSVRGGAALQGDFAAIRSGAWNHIVFRTYHAFQYRALTTAGPDDSWLYQGDFGENRNGWNYYGNYLVAYRMPIKLNLIGFLAEEDQYLYDVSGGDFWGDDVSRWTFSIIGNYLFTDRLSLTLMGQMRTMRNFVGDTGDYGFYQDRELDTDNERHLEFYRVVASLSYKLK
jgi:hypothetical protein